MIFKEEQQDGRVAKVETASPGKVSAVAGISPVQNLCESDPYMGAGSKPGGKVTILDSALHRLGTDDIEEPCALLYSCSRNFEKHDPIDISI